MTRKPLYRSLYVQVLAAILIGVLLGHFYFETGTTMQPLGDDFIKLINMIIAPIIFCTVVVGRLKGDLDVARMLRRLNNETGEEAQKPEAVLNRTEAHMAPSQPHP